MKRLLDGVNRPARSHHRMLRLARSFAVLLHGALVSIPIEGKVVLRGERLKKFRGHAESLVQFGCDVAIDPLPVALAHFGEDPFNAAQSIVNGDEEVGLFALDDVRHAVDGV